ncbi:MAG: ATP phosphoribosyltransferase [Chloroflexi bacterium]|nr:ATP phosphoribosyltransferase [Chloroflexota bacterium]MYF81872.1 ATP phosphoribosyltransferase [Chloroflexota bacterium]MYI04088.1 ATP phosphoribosyltransferase [Chloroflexota bacterium]
MLRLGMPKGSLEAPTLDLFRRAGFGVTVSSRSYFPEIDDDQISCTMFRAQEMARYVEDGVVDVGITGHDWVIETGADVVEVAEMTYSKATSRPARWVLAVPAESSVQELEQLEGGVIATELVRTTREFFAARGIDVRVEFSWGATEVKARIIDAIVDVTETGSSLRANNLRVIAEVLESTPRLIANKEAWSDPGRREKIEALNTLLQGAINATSKVGLKLNTPRSSLEDVLAVIGKFGEHAPTISPLIDDSWVALEIILDERQEREMIPELRRAGASGLVSYPLNKVIS